MLVVAHVTLGLMAWLAQDRCLLAVKEMWDGQPWCEAGGALGREAEAAPRQQRGVGSSVFDSHSPGEGHNQVITHSSASSATQLESVAAFCKDVDLRIRKHTQPQSVLCHDPTGSWKVPTAVDRGAPHHPPSLCETSLCATSLQKCEGKLEFTSPRRQILNFICIVCNK